MLNTQHQRLLDRLIKEDGGLAPGPHPVVYRGEVKRLSSGGRHRRRCPASDRRSGGCRASD
ncbi:hypothetical protein [uncultured Desulfobulbus sp.]|uniref:hypothetical protein n=1 Tax=uncultured Desulfobulbus sp. TaxID=239745 RepID=UPI0029C668DC|nr:hypothetical protein [uncultured Desulfobulbus sp.]